MQQPLSPLDGRYASQCAPIAPIVSEYGLMQYRIKTEIAWLAFLKRKGIIEKDFSEEKLEALVDGFNESEFEKIKAIEKTTRHDVKAIEYYLREHVPEEIWPWIHFACTSEDINNIAYAFQMQDARTVVLSYLKEKIIAGLKERAHEWSGVPMLARTHGQPATPTTMGKELAVYVNRIDRVTTRLSTTSVRAKWNGATGNFAAHSVAFPQLDWISFSEEFVKGLGFEWNPLTTQIESHDYQSEIFDHVGRLSSILSDLCTDVWGYISLGYFSQKLREGEVGSSTMPHKVNPIDFENARGNFKLTRGIARTLSDELPISMWQRDLSDSTMQRNLGLVFGHFLLGLTSFERGLSKIELREAALVRDLKENPEVLTEAIQTVLRKNGHADAYEKLKELSRGKRVTLEEIREFIKTLPLPELDKESLLLLTPESYVGKSRELVERFL